MGNLVVGAEIPHRIDLVFHQCDQGRYYYCSSRFHNSRELIAKRFPPSCRHKHESVAAVKNVLYYWFLGPLESIKSKVPL